MHLSPHERSSLTVKDVAKYTLLPGVVPRIKRVARSFENILFIFTQIFGTIGLIERDHPCLRAENIGHYRFADVLRYAMSNLRFTRAGLPQILMFGAVIASIVLLIGIFFVIIAQVAFPVYEANAQFFGKPEDGYMGYEKDHVMRFLSRVFNGSSFGGNLGFFGDTVVGSNQGFIALLTGMLKGYSMALLVIACFMILYLLIITAVESAKTGEPFGSRFDGAWAPIRLAMAVGLLVPIHGQGYNGAQMVAFQTAEWGSNLATNLWLGAIDNLKEMKAFAAPQPDPGYKFVHDYFLMHVCHEFLVKASALSQIEGKEKSDRRDTPSYRYMYKGHEDDLGYCGEVQIPNTDGNSYAIANSFPEQFRNSTGAFPGFLATQYAAIPAALDALMIATAKEVAEQALGSSDDQNNKTKNIAAIVTPTLVRSWVKEYWKFVGGQPANNGYPLFFTGSNWSGTYGPVNQWFMDTLKEDAKYGWSTAGAFYLRMGNMYELLKKIVADNPQMTSVPRNFDHPLATPTMLFPEVGFLQDLMMYCLPFGDTWIGGVLCPENVVTPLRLFATLRLSSKAVKDAPTRQLVGSAELAKDVGGPAAWSGALSDMADGAQSENVNTSGTIGDITESVLAKIRIKNNDLEPMGTVISYGTNLMGTSTFVFIASAAISYIMPSMGDLLKTLGIMLLSSGFLLAVVLPFMPFMYFMFAVIEWVISVLEAVIGMPLWALSFISLEGDALGKGMQGVMMLFEIMLRPAIIIMALICAVLVFSASVSFFNGMFAIYRDASDTSDAITDSLRSLSYMLLYLFIIYITATSSFKLIDAIPNSFMRWLPGGANGFGGQIKAGAVDNILAAAGGAKVLGLVDKGLSGVNNRVANLPKPKFGGNTAQSNAGAATTGGGGGGNSKPPMSVPRPDAGHSLTPPPKSRIGPDDDYDGA